MRRLWALALEWPTLSLSVFVLLIFVPGLASLPPVDRDESRFAQATAQMIETGNFIEIRFQDAPRHKKPAGIHWLQALSVTLFSDVNSREIWAYRIPSLVGAVIAAFLTYWGGRAFFDKSIALLGALFLAASLLVIAEAHVATTDAALLACVTASQFALGQIYMGAKRGQAATGFTSPGIPALIFWVAIGCGLMIKGPIGPFLSFLTIVCLCMVDRQWRWLERLLPLPGLVLVVVITAPWATAIWSATDGAFFYDTLSTEVWGKVTKAQEFHSGPPGYHMALLPILFWPASLFLIPAMLHSWRSRSQPEIRFCLCWIIPTWIVLEAAMTKLPHYTLPLFPAVSLLCACAVFRGGKYLGALHESGRTTVAKLWVVMWSAITILLAATPTILLIRYEDRLSPGAFAIGVAVIILAASGIKYALNGKLTQTAALCLGASMATTVLWLQVTLPNLEYFSLSPRIAELLDRHEPDRSEPVTLVGFTEPSAVFVLGTDTRLAGAGEAADHLAGSAALALVDGRETQNFFTEVSKLRMSVEEIESIKGFNYSNARDLNLTLYRTAK